MADLTNGQLADGAPAGRP